MATNKLATPDGVILRTDSAVAITGTTEQTIIAYPMQAGALSMVNRLKGQLFFTLSTATLLPGTLTIRLYYGTAVLTLGSGALTLIGGATDAPFTVAFRLANKGDTGSQYFYAETRQASGGLSLGSPISQANSWPAMDSTVTQLFKITAQFSNASASNILTLQDGDGDLS